MADTVTVTSGAASTLPDGTKILTDDTGAGGHAQIVKLAYSADGVATMIPADVNGLTVQVATGAVTATGTVGIEASATGGMSTFYSLDIDESEEEVKATAGTLYGFHVVNRSTGARYLKFYNATAANVIVGTTVPRNTFPIPFAASGYTGTVMFGALGIDYGTAITVAATTGFADNDTGGPSANDVIVNVMFK